jgi:predicted Zn-dependent protease
MNETIARYEKMVEQFPENELAQFSLGKALFDAGEFARAESTSKLPSRRSRTGWSFKS